MQGKNKTQSQIPKSGDGTQDVRKDRDANWFGASQEPQEEFLEDEHRGDSRSSSGSGSGSNSSENRRLAGEPLIEEGDRTKMSGSDEGIPTFSGTRPPGTPQRAVESDLRDQRGRGFVEGSNDGRAAADIESGVRADSDERDERVDAKSQYTRKPRDIDNRH